MSADSANRTLSPVKGRDFLQDPPVSWRNGGTALLLNPRLPEPLRNSVLAAGFPDLADHVWIATSGTSGKLKVIALSHAALEASAHAVNRHLAADSSDCWLNPLPLFHVGGLGIVVRTALAGNRCVFLPRWSTAEFVRTAEEQKATLSSLVPAQVHDLVLACATCPPALRAVVVGGGALDESLHQRAAELGWTLLPSYGLTEAASQVATARPGACDFSRLPLLEHVEARVGEGGILELRGPSLLAGWMRFDARGASCWEDPKSDGWLRTSDRCEVQDGKLRVLGRADDLVKIRGELVDVGALERMLQERVSAGLVRIDVEPDERNGARLHVLTENAGTETEARRVEDVFPAYARPSSYRIGRVDIGPLGKKVRSSFTD